MTTRLQLYNNALWLCGERALATLTENREPRRLLDNVWDQGWVKACLEMGQWKFATRSVLLDYDPSVTPTFGYSRAFQKPTDWCCTEAVSADEYFKTPLNEYNDEGGYWYADYDQIYIRYVSDDNSYGNDLSTWTELFTNFAAAYGANEIVLKLTSDKNRAILVKNALKDAKREAKNHNFQGEPTKFPPQGAWNRARHSGLSRRRDGGSNSTLIG